MVETVGDALPREIARVRDQVMPHYLACGAAGLPAVTIMRAELDAAARALASGDVAAMIAALNDLREWKP